MNGKFYANIFVHFEPMGDPTSTEQLPEVGSHPPYLVPGSPWEEYYFDKFHYGWTLLTDIEGLAQRGDLHTLKYVAQRGPETITDLGRRCRIMKIATTHRHVDLVTFLVEEMDYDINMVCSAHTPLDFARQELLENDPMVVFLLEKGAVTYQTLIEENPELIETFDERCFVLAEAAAFGWKDLMEFLFEEMEYDINMVCNGIFTPLDAVMARHADGDDPMLAYLIENDAHYRIDLEEYEPPISPVMDDRCDMMEAAIEFGSPDVLHFLIRTLNFDINMVCDPFSPQPYTALDMASIIWGGDEDSEIIAFLVEYGGRSFREINDYHESHDNDDGDEEEAWSEEDEL